MATAKQTKELMPDATQQDEVINVVVEETASVTPGRFFTIPGRDPFDEIEWELRSAVIGNERGELVFERRRARGVHRLDPAPGLRVRCADRRAAARGREDEEERWEAGSERHRASVGE